MNWKHVIASLRRQADATPVYIAAHGHTTYGYTATYGHPSTLQVDPVAQSKRELLYSLAKALEEGLSH